MNACRQQRLVKSAPLRFLTNAFRAVLDEGWDRDAPSAKDLGVHGNRRDIPSGAGAGVRHVELGSQNIFQGKTVTRMTGSRNQRLDTPQIQFKELIDLRIRIRVDKHSLDRIALEATSFNQIADHRFARLHNSCQRIALHCHIRKHRLFFE